MKNTTAGNDLPRLSPDMNVRCDFKDQLKHCTDAELVFLEGVYRILPDTRLKMPDKHRLKRMAPKRFSFTVASLAAAVTAVAIPFVAVNDTYRPPTVVLCETLFDDVSDNPNWRSETNVETETPLVGAMREADKPADGRVPAARRKSKKLPVRNLAPATDEHARRNTLEPLSGISPPTLVTSTMDGRRIVPRYTHVEPYRGKESVLAELAEWKLNDVRAEKLPVLVGLADLLKHRSEMDKYIKAWLDNNRDVPFDIYAEVTNEDKVKEIYDESGHIVKVIFFTSTPVNYGKSSNHY